MSREIFGISMTLFYYYTYLKSFKDFDRSEISVSCVFLSCKIDFNFLKFEDVMMIYESLKKKKTPPPDLIKFEIEIMNFLGFEINIDTPYKYIYYYLEKSRSDRLKDSEFKNLVFNLINDSYRKPLCLFWHPRYIALAALIYAFEFLNYPFDIKDFINYDKTVNPEMLQLCLDNLVKIFEHKFV